MQPLPEYHQVVSALSPVLHNLLFKVVGIDGADGVGKTTLGRYLAWHFNVSLIESDLYSEDLSAGSYQLSCIQAAINHRRKADRPVILEGVALLSLCDQLNLTPDFLIYVENSEYDGSNILSSMLASYREEFNPMACANLTIELRRA